MFVPFESLVEESRVWIYLSDRPFSQQEEEIVSQKIRDFCAQWEAHGHALKSSFQIVYHQFVVLGVDPSFNEASGCSIDGSVKVLKNLQLEMKVDLFDRNRIAFLLDNKIETHSLVRVKQLLANEQLNTAVVTFNPVIKTKQEFESEWKIEIQRSWLSKYIPKSSYYHKL